MLLGRVGHDAGRDVVVYLRIPKTGSSSLSRMLEDAFGAKRSAELPDRQVDGLDHGPRRLHDRLRRWGMRRRDGLARAAGALAGRKDPVADALFLHGHHPLWARLPTRRRPIFITMTRDPVERFLSNYYFIRAKAERGGGSRLKQAALAGDPDGFASAILRSPAAARLNGMCLYFARSGRFEDARDALEDGVFAAAPLEEIGGFARLLAGELGLPEPTVRHDNPSPGRPRDMPLSPKIEAALRDALAPDFRLHEHVAENGRRLIARAARPGRLSRKAPASKSLARQEAEPMPVQAAEIERLIKATFPSAKVEVRDLAGDGNHYAATVIDESFRGKNRVQQQRMVNAALKDILEGPNAPLHALALQTSAPE